MPFSSANYCDESGRRDSNPRRRAPKARALPGCATPRESVLLQEVVVLAQPARYRRRLPSTRSIVGRARFDPAPYGRQIARFEGKCQRLRHVVTRRSRGRPLVKRLPQWRCRCVCRAAPRHERRMTRLSLRHALPTRLGCDSADEAARCHSEVGCHAMTGTRIRRAVRGGRESEIRRIEFGPRRRP